ncbi:MAG: hypothetical protein Q9195_007536 [Heterodermia aff. obscurata]
MECTRPLELPALDIKWQDIWTKNAPEPVPRFSYGKNPQPKAYVLPMFPYPSGNLHMGHFRVYTISDVLSRFKRLQGYDVLHPMGWDAFGLPAENAAIERQIDPATWTDLNIANMKKQLIAMNSHFDWHREIRTCDPDFFMHTQELFLKLHRRGLAYQAEALVNYDPIDRTVLANEQVDSNGFSWRSGAKVEKQLRRQWFLRITAFKEALLNDLEYLSKGDRWPARIISMQRNWLGRSQGATINFQILTKEQNSPAETIQVFTTRPDTLHGVQYLALSLSHPLVETLASQLTDLQAFTESAPSMPPDSKAGFLLPGVRAFSPLSQLGDPGEYCNDVPVFVAPYVLDYGQKAVMGVPGHDSRDFAFWKLHSNGIDIRKVIEPTGVGQSEATGDSSMTGAFEDTGILALTCGAYAGLSSEEASKRIISDLGESAGESETWKLRDWLISRQRYWGAPIPIIHCPKCGAQPVPREQLPVTLPSMVSDGEGSTVAKHDENWLRTECPSCGGQAIRETDTMDTFMDSSWYFMRFLDPKNKVWLVSKKASDAYLPVDIYIGGIEHAILHLLYARFISKVLATTSTWPSGGGETNRGEPFRRVISQGMVHGKTYSDPQSGRFLKPEELDLLDPSDPKMKSTGASPNISWEKMSKSKHNGVDPLSCISRYGADITRAHMLFQAPIQQVLEWDEERIVGVERWFTRIWRYYTHPQDAAAFLISDLLTKNLHQQPGVQRRSIESIEWTSIEYEFKDMMKNNRDHFTERELKAWVQVQKTIRSVTKSMSETFALNTVISDLMELSNALMLPRLYELGSPMTYQCWSAFFRMLAPIAPAFAEECWERVHGLCKSVATPKTSIFDESWPVEDGSLEILENRGQTCSVQENGKFRFAIQIERPPEGLHQSSDIEELKAWAVKQILGSEQGQKFLEGKVLVAMHIARNGKTVNFVTPKPPQDGERNRREDSMGSSSVVQ